MIRLPSESRIFEIQRQLGCDRIPAINHLRAQTILRDRLCRGRGRRRMALSPRHTTSHGESL